MEITSKTSEIAYANYKASGKKGKDHDIITWVLGRYGNLTAYGIAKKAFFKVKINGVERKRKLGYLEVSRRMKELRELNRVEIVCKVKDEDDSTRALYRLI